MFPPRLWGPVHRAGILGDALSKEHDKGASGVTIMSFPKDAVPRGKAFEISEKEAPLLVIEVVPSHGFGGPSEPEPKERVWGMQHRPVYKDGQ